MARREWKMSEVKKAIELYESGLSWRLVGEQFGVSADCVRGAVRRVSAQYPNIDFTRKPKGWKRDKLENERPFNIALTMRCDGYTWPEIFEVVKDDVNCKTSGTLRATWASWAKKKGFLNPDLIDAGHKYRQQAGRGYAKEGYAERERRKAERKETGKTRVEDVGVEKSSNSVRRRPDVE